MMRWNHRRGVTAYLSVASWQCLLESIRYQLLESEWTDEWMDENVDADVGRSEF